MKTSKARVIRFWACTVAAVCLIMMLVLAVHMNRAMGYHINLSAVCIFVAVGGVIVWLCSAGATPDTKKHTAWDELL